MTGMRKTRTQEPSCINFWIQVHGPMPLLLVDQRDRYFHGLFNYVVLAYFKPKITANDKQGNDNTARQYWCLKKKETDFLIFTLRVSSLG